MDSWLENKASRFPGINGTVLWSHDDDAAAHASQDVVSVYSEELLMGYRWCDATGKAPPFAFGHGLDFADWSVSKLRVASAVSSTSNATVSVTLKHDGDAKHTTVVQLYLAFPEEAGEPPQLLRGFSKVSAETGASTDVEFTLSARDLSIWSVAAGAWTLVPGAFGIRVGFSSQDIAAIGTLHSSVVDSGQTAIA